MSSVSQARSLGKYFLLIDNMLVVLGFFVVFPLISIRFVDSLGWAALMVGIALGLRQLVQQGLGIFGGAIADRLGARPMIVTGMLLRAAGFATMAVAHEPWVLWLSCVLSGLGGTLFDPPRSALVVKLVRPQERGRFFSLLMMQDSAGAVTGALIGSWLLQYDFRLVCGVGALLFVLCAGFNAWLLPDWKLSTVRTPLREGMGRVLRDRRFVTYVLTLTGYYMLAVQVMLMLPVMVNDIAGEPAAVKWMYAIEAVLSLTLLYPLARFTTLLSHGILRLLGRRVKEQDITPSFNREDLAALLEANNTEQHAEPDNELKLFQNALDFADLRVRDCMVPRVDIEAVDIEETSIGQLTARFVDSKYSRIFVWRGSIDNIVGYVNSKSLFTRPAQVADVMMEVNFVPETMPLQSVLENFIKHRSNIAVVTDEFGGTAGVISLEDVLEQIFGEIEDEHDIPDLTEKRVGEDEYVLSCRLEVKYLNEKYGLGIEESREYDTLAGFIIYNYEGIPSAGETVVIGDLQLRILRTTRSRIELARVKKL